MAASTADRPVKAREGEEVWETTTAGRTFYSTTDNFGRVRESSVGGKVGAKLRIKTTDREYVQESCQNPDVDPFVNGMLVRVDEATKPEDNSPEAMRVETLLVGFTKNGNAFRAFVDGLNELNTRRMRDMAEASDATVAQVAYLEEVIKARYRKEGDTPSYRQMKQGPRE